MKKLLLPIAVLLLVLGGGIPLNAQTKTVKIKHEKVATGMNEYIITWEGSEYKPTYYAVKAVLDAEPMVASHVFLHQAQRISAMVREPWTFDHLRALFEAQGFAVVNKDDPALEAAEHR